MDLQVILAYGLFMFYYVVFSVLNIYCCLFPFVLTSLDTRMFYLVNAKVINNIYINLSIFTFTQDQRE